MKTYLVARREELKKRQNKGFTLMEMLIVVAIIAVLIAIAIPVFTSQLENSREATDAANLRSAYAEVSTAALTESATDANTGVTRTGEAGSYVWTKDVKLDQQVEGWQNNSIKTGEIGGVKVEGNITATPGGTITVTFTQTTGAVTFPAKS